MRGIVLLLAFAASCAAHAELYRWKEPGSASVRISSLPPPWMGNPGRPPVEVIPSVTRPPAGPAAAGAKGPAAPGGSGAAGDLARLESQWRSALQQLAAGVSSGAPDVKARFDVFQKLAAELERRDPAGEPRRREEADKLAQGLQPARRLK